MLKLLSILVKHRKLIILNTLIVVVLAAAISFVLPKRYTARTTVLPPETESGLSGLMGLSTGLLAQAASNFALPIMATPSDIYASMLESETILLRTIDSLDLMTAFKVTTRHAALGILRDRMSVKVEMDGIVAVEVEDRNPELAAQIANRLVISLDQLKKEMRSQKGRDFSQFLQRRLNETDSSLRRAADELRQFQQTHGAIALDVQSEALIKTLAEERAKLTATEIDLEVLRKQLYPEHPDILRKQLLVSELRNSLRRYEIGATTPRDSILSAMDVPLMRVPDLTLQLAVLTRNVKIYEMTYELLSQQFEMAQLQERRDTPTISVLDVARPPVQPVWPKKKWIVLTAAVLTFLATATFVTIREAAAVEGSAMASFGAAVRTLWRQVREKPLG
ncbi:MAG: hypothetical protein IT585_05640 [candidate division Zixibacteria bacterium]|nr:hypothetical protein [candidate division Zixibacteria bacterium]